MNPIVAYLKAFRWQNLLMMAIVMYGLRWLVFKPYLAISSLSLQFSEIDFGILVLSVVLIAAAGNIINDYFDIKIDRVNKPDRIIVGRYIKRRIAMAAHMIMNGMAMAMAIYVSVKVGSYQLALIHVIMIATLWFYSTDFKRRLVWGNLAIAFCVALVPLMVSIYEIPVLVENYTAMLEEYENPEAYQNFLIVIKTLFYWTLGYSIFALLLTFAREITKDIVDMKGDSAFGCKTMPVVLGVPRTKWIISFLYIVVMILVIYVQVTYIKAALSAYYLYGLLLPLLLATLWKTMSSKESNQFRLPSNLNKATSLVGILYMLVIYNLLLIEHALG